MAGSDDFSRSYPVYQEREKTDYIQLYRLRMQQLEKERVETRRKDGVPEVRTACDGKQPAAGKDQKSTGCDITAIWSGMGGTSIQCSLQVDSRGERHPAV